MANLKLIPRTVLFFLSLAVAYGLPEAGKVKYTLTKDNPISLFPKIAFADSKVHIAAHCSTKGDLNVTIEWRVKYSSCVKDFLRLEDDNIWKILTSEQEVRVVGKPQRCRPHLLIPQFDGKRQVFKLTTTSPSTTKANPKAPLVKTVVKKKKGHAKPGSIPKTDPSKPAAEVPVKPEAGVPAKPDGKAPLAPAGAHHAVRRGVGESSGDGAVQRDVQPAKEHAAVKAQSEDTNCTLWKEGPYLVLVRVTTRKLSNEEDFNVTVIMSIEKDHHYLSAAEWPLLVFYGVMSLFYLMFAIGWLIATCCNWRDLLRIQFWIGGVIALGMLENALFYTDYQDVNNGGIKGKPLAVIAELVSCVKRTLARILVIIVSLGFGIVKPRLGSALHKVLVVGGLFFVLAAIEGCFRAVTPKTKFTKGMVFSGIAMAVIDTGICWWIFTALIQTSRTLRIRKNVVKLTLYRHFTNTLIFLVIASIVFMVLIIKRRAIPECYDWKNLWLDEAFWPFLFIVILLLIMVLWRPTNNNQRYAFAPLMDLDEDDEDDNQTLSDAFEGMKMRSVQHPSSNGLSNRSQADDDLKWVEENLPSVPATLLPTLDSDEELMTTKYEMSKMD